MRQDPAAIMTLAAQVNGLNSSDLKPWHVRVSSVPVTRKIMVAASVIAGNRISAPPPEYPAIAKAASVQGVVLLQVGISKTGVVDYMKVVSGPPMLQQAAIDAVKTWRYKPYLLNGEPVEVESEVNVVFNLNY